MQEDAHIAALDLDPATKTSLFAGALAAAAGASCSMVVPACCITAVPETCRHSQTFQAPPTAAAAAAPSPPTVFDGHGGRAVSQFCAAHLAEEFVRSDAYRRGDLSAAITGAPMRDCVRRWPVCFLGTPVQQLRL